MDKTDRRILELLQKQARISYRELGEQVHLSPNTVAERVRRLVETGVITGFHAQLDMAALGLGVQALVEVKLKPETTAAFFEAALRGISGVVEAVLVTGGHDYQLRVVCSDQDDLVRIVEALRTHAGVSNTHSSLVLRRMVFGMPV
jgi:Lrp/AsnC family transcriptional regulator, leucine-responsive regulatory protein